MWLKSHCHVDDQHLCHIPLHRVEEPVLLAPVPNGQGYVMIDGKPVTAAQNPSANGAHPKNPHFHDDGSVFLNAGIGFNDFREVAGADGENERR